MKKYFENILTPIEAKTYLREHCYIQFISIDTVIERGKIEGLLSFTLNVKYMHEEH